MKKHGAKKKTSRHASHPSTPRTTPQITHISLPPPPPPPKKALLIEFEYFFTPCRRLLMEALKDIFSKREIKITPSDFSRFFLYPPLKQSIHNLMTAIGNKRFSEEKLYAEVAQAHATLLRNACSSAKSGILNTMATLVANHNPMGSLSYLNSEITTPMLDALALPADQLHTTSCQTEGRIMPSPDAWLKLAKSLHTQPSLCVVLAASNRACKAALSAGMRCIAIPDEFTTFQDFSGADFVFDSLDRDAIQHIMNVLKSV